MTSKTTCPPWVGRSLFPQLGATVRAVLALGATVRAVLALGATVRGATVRAVLAFAGFLALFC